MQVHYAQLIDDQDCPAHFLLPDNQHEWSLLQSGLPVGTEKNLPGDNFGLPNVELCLGVLFDGQNHLACLDKESGQIFDLYTDIGILRMVPGKVAKVQPSDLV